MEIVLRLGVHEGTHLTGHTARLVPGIERLLHRYTLILALALGHCQRIEAVKEIVGQSAHRQQPLLTFIYIDMLIGLEVDVGILRIAARILKGGHLLLHVLRTGQGLYQLHALLLLGRHGEQRFRGIAARP